MANNYGNGKKPDILKEFFGEGSKDINALFDEIDKSKTKSAESEKKRIEEEKKRAQEEKDNRTLFGGKKKDANNGHNKQGQSNLNAGNQAAKQPQQPLVFTSKPKPAPQPTPQPVHVEQEPVKEEPVAPVQKEAKQEAVRETAYPPHAVEYDPFAPPVDRVQAAPVEQEKEEPSTNTEQQHIDPINIIQEPYQPKEAVAEANVQTEDVAEKEPTQSQNDEDALLAAVSAVSKTEEEPKAELPAIKKQDNALSIRGIVPLKSDKDRRYQSAVAVVNAYSANVFLGAAYNKDIHRGAYGVVVDMGDKVYAGSFSGSTDDESEYAFAGAIAALEQPMSNNTKEITIYAAKGVCKMLQDNSFGMMFGYSETRRNYIKVAREAMENTFVKFQPNENVKSFYADLAQMLANSFVRR